MSQGDLKRKLETMRAELTDSSARTADDRRPVALDQQAVGRLSRMDAMQQQAMAVANELRRARQLNRIESALARLEDGTFGYCVMCDEEIVPKRLAFDPSIPTCLKCAQQGSA